MLLNILSRYPVYADSDNLSFLFLCYSSSLAVYCIINLLRRCNIWLCLLVKTISGTVLKFCQVCLIHTSQYSPHPRFQFCSNPAWWAEKRWRWEWPSSRQSSESLAMASFCSGTREACSRSRSTCRKMIKIG